MGKWRHTIETFKEIAIKNKGRCHSRVYKGTNSRLIFECEAGHRWAALPSNILKGTWCKKCSSLHVNDWKRLTLEEMHSIAAERNGKCLADAYINSDIPLKWSCEFGHEWSARPYHVKAGSWCPECRNKNIAAQNTKHTLTEFEDIAESRGSKVLDKKYEGFNSKLKIRCLNGHIFSMTPKNILRGQWCPICKRDSRGEIFVRTLFEHMFGQQFPKSRPKWLRGLELDGYSKTLKLAFEHHGQQHYRMVPVFHLETSDFRNQQKRDNLKAKLCERHGVELIEIPEIPELMTPQKAKSLIHQLTIKKGISYNSKTTPKWEEIFSISKKIEELRVLASKKGGRLLSRAYVNDRTKVKWACHAGHTWRAIPSNVSRGSWCPACARIAVNKPKFEREFRALKKYATTKGGKLLSKEYGGSQVHLRWQCKRGHTWRAMPLNVKRGTWCPKCYHETREANRNAQGRYA